MAVLSNDGMGNGHLLMLLVGLLVAAPGVRATRGVVRFVDARTLVIARSPQYGRELRFQLEPTTERYGEVMVGATVDVRYITKGTRSIATAVTVERVAGGSSSKSGAIRTPNPEPRTPNQEPRTKNQGLRTEN